MPDLRSAKIRDIRIVRTPGGRKLLRFTSEILNYGAGPFEIRGSRPSTSSPFDIDQMVYRSDGTIRRVQTNATVAYAGDGHDHYHVRRMMSYHLWSTRGTLRDRKIGFCFFDTNPRYLVAAARTTVEGLSRVGLRRPDGTQHAQRHLSRLGRSLSVELRVPVDRHHRSAVGFVHASRRGRSVRSFLETTDANNCSYARLTISGSTRPDRGQRHDCINDYSGTPYAG